MQHEVEQNVVELSDNLQTDTQIIENGSIECVEADNRYESSSTKLDILTDESISFASSVEDKEEEHTCQHDGRRQQVLFFAIK